MAATAGAVKASRAFVELFTDDSQLVKGLRSAERKLKTFGKSIQNIGLKFTALGAGIVTPLLAAAKVFANTGDQLDKMAKRTGFAVETLSKLDFAASQSGTSLEALEGGLRGMARFIENARRGLSTSTDTLEALGLTIADLQGMDPEAQFRTLAERLAAIEDPTMRAGLAMQAFGRSGSALIPLLGDVNRLMDEASDAGLVISTEQAEEAAKLTDAMDKLKRTLTVVAVEVGGAVAPVLTALSGDIAQVARDVGEWISRNREIIPTVLKFGAGVTAMGVALTALGKIIAVGGAVLGGLATLSTSLTGIVAVMTGPVGIVAAVAAIAALTFELPGVDTVLNQLGQVLEMLGILQQRGGGRATGNAPIPSSVLARRQELAAPGDWLENLSRALPQGPRPAEGYKPFEVGDALAFSSIQQRQQGVQRAQELVGGTFSADRRQFGAGGQNIQQKLLTETETQTEELRQMKQAIESGLLIT